MIKYSIVSALSYFKWKTDFLIFFLWTEEAMIMSDEIEISSLFYISHRERYKILNKDALL